MKKFLAYWRIINSVLDLANVPYLPFLKVIVFVDFTLAYLTKKGEVNYP